MKNEITKKEEDYTISITTLIIFHDMLLKTAFNIQFTIISSDKDTSSYVQKKKREVYYYG